MNNLWILAQQDQETGVITQEPIGTEETTNTTTTTTTAEDPNVPAPTNLKDTLRGMWPFLLIFVVMYFILFRGPKKKQQQHKQMIKTTQKNDKVRTIGGIVGTVVDVRDDEIVLKIDESNNTKIKIIPSAIGKNLTQSNES